MGASAFAQDKFITVASTTSTEQSGLFKHLLPAFQKKSGIQVRVVALGTGQALDMARRGDADVVFVHDKVAEEKFAADGFGLQRFDVMYNDFVLVGPKSDPAKIAGSKDIMDAYKKIAASAAPFASRGDKSGTHAAELRLWKAASIDPQSGKGSWYRETGSGMGPTLNTASAMNAHVFTDRATWLAFKNRGALVILVEGDQRLFNQYGVMLVNPARHEHVKREAGQAFIDWLIAVEGQKAIAGYQIGGQQLFFPNAKTVGWVKPITTVDCVCDGFHPSYAVSSSFSAASVITTASVTSKAFCLRNCNPSQVPTSAPPSALMASHGNSGGSALVTCQPATSATMEFTMMNGADMPAVVFVPAHARISSSGLKNMPPPVPVKPEMKPMAAPMNIAGTTLTRIRPSSMVRGEANARHAM